MLKRRTFLKLSALMSMYPLFAATQSTEEDTLRRELMGLVSPKLHGDNFNLRKEAADAFVKMRAAAEKEGIKLYSQSSYRSFTHQKSIWERKYKRFIGQGMSPMEAVTAIVEYSTIPGTSRHHWGTDLDVVDLAVNQPADRLLAKNFLKGGAYEKLYSWLNQHANDFGFYEVYTSKSDRKGFSYEPWHYSYKPLAQGYLQTYLKYDLESELKKLSISGASHFDSSFVHNYIEQNINDINPVLR